MTINSINYSQVLVSVLGALVTSTLFLAAAIGPAGQLI